MSDRVALVIGGGSGLGAATAVALAGDGCRVVTADLTGADQVVDVTDEASVAALFAGVVEREGRLDVVVTTAGVSTLAAVADHDAAEWRRVLDVNLTGAFLVIKHAAAHLGAGGSITSLTSLNARQPGAGLAAYCASKAGLASLTEVAALELGPRGIRVNSVAPSYIYEDVNKGYFDWLASEAGVTHDDIYQQKAEPTDLKRLASSEEVARAALFLASDLASAVTGQMLTVDCGEFHD